MMSFSEAYILESIEILKRIDISQIEKMIQLLIDLRARQGRLFFLGVGGSAANCSHAVNDFRKIVGIEAYTPVDNIAELTARTNDEGWETVFKEWLKGSSLSSKDALFVLSVGGGDKARNVSPNIVYALEYVVSMGAKILGIVGRDGGYTAKVADACVIIPTINAQHTTPHAEAFQGVIWHLLVSDPRLKSVKNKWEFIEKEDRVQV